MMKFLESDANLGSYSKPYNIKPIINAKPIVTITTTKVQPKEPEDPEKGEHLFHS